MREGDANAVGTGSDGWTDECRRTGRIKAQERGAAQVTLGLFFLAGREFSLDLH